MAHSLWTVAPEAQKNPLVLRFGGRLVEQLGAQLYPRVTASVAELVSNAWDADAAHVWITIPFDEDWKTEAAITVLDDGIGMTYEEARTQYLFVGRNRRIKGGETSQGGRPLHGRKGIGKLAAFGTATYLECVTVSNGAMTAFGIDYDKLRDYDPDEDYPVEVIPDPAPLVNPDSGETMAHGTRVRLTGLKAKRRTGEAQFRRSMERRFALDSSAMIVSVNKTPLKRYNTPVEVRFPRDGVPPKSNATVESNGWARELIPNPTEEDPDRKSEVRWWIGFTKTPIADEDMRGVSVLSRGKLAQRPFMFERALGTTGQLGQEYLVGEVAAEWLDHGVDAAEDLIQSNRDQLQLDNAELEPFMQWGRSLITWALAQRNRVQREQNLGPGALGDEVEGILASVPPSNRERFRTLAGRIAEITQADQKGVAEAVRAVAEASDAKATELVAADLALVGDPDDEETWKLLRDARDGVRSADRALLVARADMLASFLTAVEEPPVSLLHREIPTSPWLISPLLADVPVETVHGDSDVCVIQLKALPPILGELTIACWAVGSEPGDRPGPPADIEIASEWERETVGKLTWQEVLGDSARAHDALIENLEDPPDAH
jgi:hypothetical protein